MKWLENEPALNEEALCMAVILHMNGAVLHAKLDNCDKAAHNFVCITYPCGNEGVGCWGRHSKIDKKKGQEHAIVFPPKLEIRYTLFCFYLHSLPRPTSAIASRTREWSGTIYSYKRMILLWKHILYGTVFYLNCLCNSRNLFSQSM